jgi:ribosome biogenesis GTPase
MSRKKGKSQRKQRDFTTSSGPGFKEAQGDMDAPGFVRQKETARAAKLPSWRQESSLESFADLPRCEGMVVGLFPAGAIVRIADKDLICGLAGTFRPPAGSSALAVGDQVTIAMTKSQHSDADGEDKLRADGKIVDRRPRRSLLARPQPRSGKRREFYQEENFLKVIAANMDQLVIIASICQPAIKKALIERFMIIAERGDLTSLLVVNKSDLADIDAELLADLAAMGLDVISASAVSGAGLAEIRSRLIGKRSIFAGASGVGKSSLINALVPSAQAATGLVRIKDKRGRHTTASASVYYLEGPTQEQRGMLIDTPGVRELGMRMDAAELPWYFPEFEAFSGQCKFNDCTHTHEPRCAVIAAVEEGKIIPQRFASYLRLMETLEEQR